MTRVAIGFLLLCALVAVAGGVRAAVRVEAPGQDREIVPLAAGELLPGPGATGPG